MARLAREHEPAARLEHAQHLAQRHRHVRDVVQHGVPDDQVERLVLVRDALGVGDPAVHRQAEVLGVVQRDLHHARRQVGHRALLGHAALHQVQQEETRPAAQFHGPPVRPALVAGHGAEPADGVVDAALVVRDRPFLVVAASLPVVVEHVGKLRVATRPPGPLPRWRAGGVRDRSWRCRASLSGEGGLAGPVLDERTHAGPLVVGREQRGEQVALQLQSAGQVAVQAAVDGGLGGRERDGGAGRELVRPRCAPPSTRRRVRRPRRPGRWPTPRPPARTGR